MDELNKYTSNLSKPVNDIPQKANTKTNTNLSLIEQKVEQTNKNKREEITPVCSLCPSLTPYVVLGTIQSAIAPFNPKGPIFEIKDMCIY